MLKEQDIIDIVCENLLNSSKKGNCAGGVSYKSGFFTKKRWIESYSSLNNNRQLITEYEIRKVVQKGERTIKISKDAIIGPLALELIQEKAIKIVRE
ncbi:MAG: hypothetical protein BWY26_00514 [Elusimicrobia bacterium ADurb.Bin231]|nr:MAG: hypothetical protein BWY26_00514 [Elusimicrobia bacterium ADurb.Bin231]